MNCKIQMTMNKDFGVQIVCSLIWADL